MQRVIITVGGFLPRGEVITMTVEVYMALVATLTLLVTVIALLRK